jgi:diguanylate cyclase (GGDEF)-like protein
MATTQSAPGNERDMAVRELAGLRRDIEQARDALARVRDEASDARLQGAVLTSQIVDANEQLVLSALRAQSDAASAVQALQQGARSAQHDVLTDLPNRLLLLDRLTLAIAHARRSGGRLALLFLDLDNFSQVNDALGHAGGDAALRLAAKRMSTAVRDMDTVSRHGGDEFLVLLPDVSREQAVMIADKLNAALGVPATMGAHVLRLAASIGVSFFPDDGDEAAVLVERADMAMFRAKREGLRMRVSVPAGSEEDPTVPAALDALKSPLATFEHSRIEQDARYRHMLEANERLIVAALTAQELQTAAEASQARQTGLLALVAHELRHPLAPIRTAASMLGRARADEPLLLRVQAIIERQVAHMARLIGDLLDVSRSNTGKLRLERRIVDLVDLIDEAVLSCRPAMDARLQSFRSFVAARPLRLHGDAVRLTQVLCNLLDNASKYTQVGGEIGLSVVKDGRTVALTISDNGIGISPVALPKVFDPFVQDQHAIGFNGAGLGIGLTVVRELVEAHGGTVLASSAGVGFGSQFVVTLELA